MEIENVEQFLDADENELVQLKYPVDSDLTPPEAYSILREYDDSGYTFLLESAETETSAIRQVTEETEPLDDRGKYSQIGYNPAALIEVQGENLELKVLREDNYPKFLEEISDYEGNNVSDQLDVLRDVSLELEEVDGNEDRPTFTGGFVGFHPYDIVYDIKPLFNTDNVTAQSRFVLADRFLEYDHKENRTELVYTPLPNNNLSRLEQLVEINEEAEEIIDLLNNSKPEIKENITVLEEEAGGREDYENSVREVKEDILNGEIYQGVISRKNQLEMDGDPLTIYSALREKNPSPYMYILEFDGHGVLGASPETLVSVHSENGEEIVETNPIAGTRPRGESPDEDRKLMGDMLADDKERAEHNMLVDLGRNDLRKVSKQGSVSVYDYMSVVQYENVQHLESRASAKLSEDNDRLDAMRSVFPAGTLSGAPKIRAMDIIADQEQSGRGIYGGAVGYYSLNGDLNSAIAIRSLEFEEDEESLIGTIQAGAGIVQDSQPEREFEETEAKMSSLTQVINDLEGEAE